MSERFVTAADGVELFVRAYGVASDLVPVVCFSSATSRWAKPGRC